MALSKAEMDEAYDAHRRDQIRHIARTTTPDDRIRWLRQILELNPEARLREVKRRSDRAMAIWEGREAR